MGGFQGSGWKANLQRGWGKGISASPHMTSISLGGALRKDENRMAARKLVRKHAVG